jgi:ribosome biogenesis protein Nip4
LKGKNSKKFSIKKLPIKEKLVILPEVQDDSEKKHCHAELVEVLNGILISGEKQDLCHAELVEALNENVIKEKANGLHNLHCLFFYAPPFDRLRML